MSVVTVEWDLIQRRRIRIEVPDDATQEDISERADKVVRGERIRQLDEVLGEVVGSVQWTAPDGRFGGTVR